MSRINLSHYLNLYKVTLLFFQSKLRNSLVCSLQCCNTTENSHIQNFIITVRKSFFIDKNGANTTKLKLLACQKATKKFVITQVHSYKTSLGSKLSNFLIRRSLRLPRVLFLIFRAWQAIKLDEN